MLLLLLAIVFLLWHFCRPRDGVEPSLNSPVVPAESSVLLFCYVLWLIVIVLMFCFVLLFHILLSQCDVSSYNGHGCRHKRTGKYEAHLWHREAQQGCHEYRSHHFQSTWMLMYWTFGDMPPSSPLDRQLSPLIVLLSYVFLCSHEVIKMASQTASGEQEKSKGIVCGGRKGFFRSSL